MKTLLERFEGKYIPEPNTGCWIWTGAMYNGGYGQMRTTAVGTPRSLAHRVAWQLFNGDIPEGVKVLHRCDTPPCVNPEHLFLGTLSDNTLDAYAKGRIVSRAGCLFPYLAVGEKNHRSKLVDREVKAIRKSRESGSTLAKFYNVSQATISEVRHGHRWKHLLDSMN